MNQALLLFNGGPLSGFSVRICFLGDEPPPKLTCPLKNSGWKTTFLVKWSCFTGHVNFRGMSDVDETSKSSLPKSLSLSIIFSLNFPGFWSKWYEPKAEFSSVFRQFSLNKLHLKSFDLAVWTWHFPKIEWRVSKTTQGSQYYHGTVDGKRSCTSWYGKYPIIYRVSYMSCGAGFLPSTVSWYLSKFHKTTAGEAVQKQLLDTHVFPSRPSKQTNNYPLTSVCWWT